MLSKFLGGLGRTLITAGTLILLFVAYQLWGTGIQEAHSQKALKSEFADVLKTTPTTGSTTTTAPPSTTAGPSFTNPQDPGAPPPNQPIRVTPVATAPADLPLPAYGDPIAQIRIPKIGVTRTVVQGVGLDQLKRGPGHYPDTPLPGQAGNASIAGHRTTYGQPFHNVDKLRDGDQIILKTPQGEFVYKIDRITIVKPDATEVLLPTKGADGKLESRITLTACHPKYSAKLRIIVSGLLDGTPAPPLVGQAEAQKQIIAKQAAVGKGDVRGATIDGGLSGVKKSKTPVYVWAGILVLIWFATWLVQTFLRRIMRRRASGERSGPTRGQRALTWTPYLVGLPVFMVALYVFFENFSRLLPGNY
ncbi:MAG: class E sortase [Actinomycetota bacterium]|nr:class E sortase [Actinomycetota bacterium]